MLRSIDLNLLRSLDVLLEECHVTRAAKRLGMSQPALSAQLSRLRAIFDDPLLVASGKTLVPTRRALALQEDLRAHLLGLSGLLSRDTAFDPATARVDFRIAGSDAAHRVIGEPLVAELQQAAPYCRLALVQPSRELIEIDMERGRIALLITAKEVPRTAWRREKLVSESFRTVMRADHPLARSDLTIDAFCAARHLLVAPSGNPFEGKIDAVLAGMGRSRRIAVSVQSFLLVPGMLRATDMIATMPSKLAHSFSDHYAVRTPPIETPGFDVFMVWHPNTDHEPAHAWLRERLRAIVAGLRHDEMPVDLEVG